MKKIIVLLLGGILVLFFSGGIGINPALAKDSTKLKVFVHQPGKPVPVSTCTITTNANVDDWGVAGWQMPSAGLTYKINFVTKPANLTNTQVSDAISTSFNTWSTADSKQIFIYGGSTSVKGAKYDGTNAILFKRISSSALAITYVWYYPSTGQLLETDTVFNSAYKWSYTTYNGTNDCGGVAGTYDVQNIGTHEFGHWVGLDDLYNSVDKDLTMYGYGDTKELKADSLGLGDINGAKAIAP